MIFEVAVGVEREHGDPIARLDAKRLQPAGKPRHAIGKLSESAAAVAKAHRGALGMLLDRAVKGLGEIHGRRLLAIDQGECTREPGRLKSVPAESVSFTVGLPLPAHRDRVYPWESPGELWLKPGIHL